MVESRDGESGGRKDDIQLMRMPPTREDPDQRDRTDRTEQERERERKREKTQRQRERIQR
jgi:hypothetical protein